ncbi:S1 RNA-binding domain-containing protein [Candidatus Peribacteria bacterium]|nr:S1 RNA-binding domain-containing protein [Candidatus Peribacteria bacterium]
MSSSLPSYATGVVLYKPGTNVTGTVIDATSSRILLSLPGGVTGIITKKERSAYDDGESFEPGQEVEAAIINEEDENGLVVLSLRRASQDKAWSELHRMMEDEVIFKAKFYEANKGGLMAKYKGLRMFLPVSQLTPAHYPRLGSANGAAIQSKLEEFMGQEFAVRVINVDRERDKIIISEKAAYADRAKKTLERLSVGDVVRGEISGIVKYGVFVEHEGVEGLVHLSEISWDHVGDPQKLFHMGDSVEVQVIGMDGDKLSFSMKRTQHDPWLQHIEPYNVGQIVTAEITRWNENGVFVQVDENVQGLIPLSDFGVEDHQDLRLREGQEVFAKVLAINTESRRLELERVSADEAAAASEKSAEDATLQAALAAANAVLEGAKK